MRVVVVAMGRGRTSSDTADRPDAPTITIRHHCLFCCSVHFCADDALDL